MGTQLFPGSYVRQKIVDVFPRLVGGSCFVSCFMLLTNFAGWFRSSYVSVSLISSSNTMSRAFGF